jgi:hypothetical protein
MFLKLFDIGSYGSFNLVDGEHQDFIFGVVGGLMRLKGLMRLRGIDEIEGIEGIDEIERIEANEVTI